MSDTATIAPLDAVKILELQTELTAIQDKAGKHEAVELELRRAIEIVRLLRRTNTGPAGSRKRKSPASTDATFDPLALLNQRLSGT